MRILIVGTGYVGLVTGACFAEMGHHVTCLDNNSEKIKLLPDVIPIYEPGLEELVKRNAQANRLHFTTSYDMALQECSVCFLALPTPALEDGSCDVRYLLEAAAEIARHMQNNLIVVIKSTAPVGSAQKVKEAIRNVLDARGLKLEVDVVSNPEFLKEGSAVSDCMKPDRIVIGVDSQQAACVMREIYAPFTLNHDRMLIMDNPSAEMTKYAANAMLAARISLMNELAGLCEKTGANINDVRIGIGSDVRIGYQFLYAGIGYGGSCFPKDIRALIATAKEMGYAMPILEAVDSINQNQKRLLGAKIASYFAQKGGVANKTIAIWGLAFKPNTDDMREAPSLHLIQDLLAQGATVRLYDPIAMSQAKKILPDKGQIQWCNDEYHAAENVDAIALVTEWKQFRFVDFQKILSQMQGCGFFDGRNQYKPHEMKAKGFDYFGIGIPH